MDEQPPAHEKRERGESKVQGLTSQARTSYPTACDPCEAQIDEHEAQEDRRVRKGSDLGDITHQNEASRDARYEQGGLLAPRPGRRARTRRPSG